MIYTKRLKKDFILTTDTSLFDYDIIFDLVLGKERSKFMCNVKKKAFEHSLCFGIFFKKYQIGFMRAITDTVNFAYICDVNIKKEYQNLGIGKLAFEQLMKHPDLKYVGKWRLDTENAHGFYEHFGFHKIEDIGNCMEYLNL